MIFEFSNLVWLYAAGNIHSSYCLSFGNQIIKLAFKRVYDVSVGFPTRELSHPVENWFHTRRSRLGIPARQ